MKRKMMRILTEIRTNICRNWFVFITSVLTIFISSFIIGLLLTGLLNLETISNQITESIKIYVQIDDDLNPAGIELLKSKIETLGETSSITFTDKDEALNQYVDFYGENGEFFEMWREDNPLKNSFTIALNNSEKVDEIASQLRDLNGVYEVTYGGDSVLKALDMLGSIKVGGAIGSLLFLILMIFVLSNIINQTIYNRKDEIGIMSSVGASPKYIRDPFIAEGIVICLSGCIPASVVLSLVYEQIYKVMDDSVLPGSLELYNPNMIICFLLVTFILLGSTIGAICAAAQTNKHLK